MAPTDWKATSPIRWPRSPRRSATTGERQDTGGTMKAVRSVEGGVAVVDVDEPPGTGQRLEMKATSVCGSDLSYIQFGSQSILGHELAGIREDGTAVVVEAIYGCMECEQCVSGAYNL